MPIPELALALLALLLTPGPTNTLMALAGAERGVWRALPLMTAELGGYLIVVVPLALFGAELLEQFAMARPVVTMIAALWVLWLAVGMWRLPGANDLRAAPAVSAARVFVTTVLNPKGLVIGLALLPGGGTLAPRLAVFALITAAVATVWAATGACLARRSDCPLGALPPLLCRIAAAWLALLSLGLAAAAFPA